MNSPHKVKLEDQEILKRIRQNDRKAFEELFFDNYPSLYEYALFYVGNSQQAEDIVQDVFLKIWDSRKRLIIKSSLRGYLYRSIHNHCIQYLRHLTVKQNHQASHKAKMEEVQLMNRLFFENGYSTLFKNEIKSIVAKAIEQLPEKTYEIYVLSRHKYMKNRDIAKKYDLSEKSVEYHLSKALDLLRKQLKEYLPLALVLLFSGMLHL